MSKKALVDLSSGVGIHSLPIPNPSRFIVVLVVVALLMLFFSVCCCLGVSGCHTSPQRTNGDGVTPPTSHTNNDEIAVPVEPQTTGGVSEGESERPTAKASLPPIELPPSSPDLEPQLVACSERRFARIDSSSLQVFKLKGAGARAKQVAHIDVDAPRNLIALAGESRLVITKENLFRHYRDDREAKRYVRIPLLGPLVAWPEAREINSFWVRYLRDPDLHYYTLAPTAESEETSSADAQRPFPVTIGQVRPLHDFDQRLFTLMADGTPFYSTSGGLVGGKRPLRYSPLPPLQQELALMWADSTYHRYWVSDRAGNLGVWERSRGEPRLVTARLPGPVVATDVLGATAAILSVRQLGGRYQTEVTLFEEHNFSKRWLVSDTPLTDGQPVLDLCLLNGSKRLVVGGRDWLGLYDRRSGKLLQEW